MEPITRAIHDKYYPLGLLCDDPVKQGLAYSFAQLMEGSLSPDRARKMLRDEDMREWLDDEDYATWTRMTSCAAGDER